MLNVLQIKAGHKRGVRLKYKQNMNKTVCVKIQLKSVEINEDPSGCSERADT